MKRVLIWSQHLLGTGHFVRARHIAEALAQAGFEVLLVNGGVLPADAKLADVRLVQLPAVKSKDELFDELVDADGSDVTPALMAARRDLLLETWRSFQPDCVVTETFPFGRRLVQAELLELIAVIRAEAPRTKLVASVRDILQRPRKDERAAAMVQLARDHYHMVLVHSDPQIVRAEVSFPEIASIQRLLRYTGYVCVTDKHSRTKRDEVIVSAGGGAVGSQLVSVAQRAKPLSVLRDRPWIIVCGAMSTQTESSADGTQLVRTLPDFQARLASAALSVSQAGYNTMAEVLSFRTPAVVVPFETEREREQITRAELLQARGLVTVLRSADLAPARLAQAVDEAHGKILPPHTVNIDGAQGTVAALRELLND